MRSRIALVVALAITAVVPAVGATATGPPAPPAPDSSSQAAGDPVQDDLLQITLNRLVAEAPEFGSFERCEGIVNPCDTGTNAVISVVRLDNGARADVNGDAGQISLSSVKALWVVMAVTEAGVEAVGKHAPAIFRKSDNTAAGHVIDLLGDPPSDGIDAINAATAAWGLTDTWLRGWYLGRAASRPYPAGMGVWGTNNYTTANDLAEFWAMLGRGELLSPEETGQVIDWASLPRPHEHNELITNRLPSEVAAGVAHKSGWRTEGSNRRIDGGVVTTSGGVRYSIAIGFRAGGVISYSGGSEDWARYASCEVYNLIAEATRTCTRTGDPSAIVNHTTAPVGSLSSAIGERDRLRVDGWALDRDAGAGPVDVTISMDGRTIATITADRLKTSIHRRHGMGNYHGFRSEIESSLSPGSHRVCATAINDTTSGGNRSIGCRTITVSADHPPTGTLESVRIKPDLVIAWGRAKDADTDGSIEVKLTLDGAKLKRIDADRGANGHTFKLRLRRTVPPGEHRICAIAQNYHGGGPNRTIGCQTVVVPDDWPPTGNLIAASVTSDGSLVSVKGRAWDPDAAGAIEVRVEVDGTVVGSLLADRGPAESKYVGTVEVALPSGDHPVCTFGISRDGGEPVTQLGCATVTVTGA